MSQQYYGQPYGAGYGPAYGAPVGPPPPPDPDRRPATVTAAGVTAMVSSGLVALFTLLGLILLAVSRDGLERELRGQPELAESGIAVGDLYGVVLAFLVVVLLWSVAGVAFGWMSLRRSQAGRILLVISASITAVLSLLAIGSLVSGVTLIAAVAVIVLLFVGGANEWFSRSQQPYAQQPYPQQPYAQGPYAQQPYTQPYPQPPYAQQPSGHWPYGEQPPPPNPYAQEPYRSRDHGQPPTYPERPTGDEPVQQPWGDSGGDSGSSGDR